jgi:hypothetical protein
MNSKVVLTKDGSQAKGLKFSGKKSYSYYQFRADIQTLDHRPQFKAEIDAAEIDACPKNIRFVPGGCCCLFKII